MAVDLHWRLTHSSRLSDYPSGSAITYHDRQLFVVGDDAVAVQVLDASYRPMRQVRTEDHPEPRIPKPVKPDYEASALVRDNHHHSLLVIGSAATEKRKRLLLLPLSDHEHRISRFDTTEFVSRIHHMGVREINLEGVTAINAHMVLVNRGNLGYPHNHFIVTDSGFWKHQETAPIRLAGTDTGPFVRDFVGISDLCYLAERDLLLLCFSSEQTSNAYDDGAIGLSYLGWIGAFSSHFAADRWPLDDMISLPSLDPVFRGQKIEGLHAVCSEAGKIIVRMVADNDTGDTGIFELTEE